MDCVVPLKSEFDHVSGACSTSNSNAMAQMGVHPVLNGDTQVSLIEVQKNQSEHNTVSNQLASYDVKGNHLFITLLLLMVRK